MVPVEMIRRDVQDGGDPGAKLFDGLQLEARDLKDGDRIRGGLRSKRDHGRSDVTADECFFAGLWSSGGENFSDQSGGGSLGIGDGGWNDFSLEGSKSQLGFPH